MKSMTLIDTGSKVVFAMTSQLLQVMSLQWAESILYQMGLYFVAWDSYFYYSVGLQKSILNSFKHTQLYCAKF